tara:strand:- start:85451 stop:86026 length:576 start_codon:yes stop_codon:yes gene_type:complete
MERQNNIVEQSKLVVAIKANNSKVLQQLYQENYKKVEIHIVNNSGSIPQAQDTYQEAFLACYQNIKADKFEPNSETALQGYLFTIAKNKWTDYLRSSQFKKVQGMSEGISATMKDEDTIPVENNLAQLQMNATIDAFSRLGNECKELLKLFYYEKKSMEEISAEKNLTSASARNKKYRCIQKLKTLVAHPK